MDEEDIFIDFSITQNKILEERDDYISDLEDDLNKDEIEEE